MNVKFGDGSEIDEDRLREYGTILHPNPDDQDAAVAEVEEMLPVILDDILMRSPAGTRVLHREVVIGDPAHTPGSNAPVGFYAILEVPA